MHSFGVYSALSVLIVLCASTSHRAMAEERPTTAAYAAKEEPTLSKNVLAEKGHQHLTDDELKQRGKQLRVAIENKYKELSENNQLIRNGSVPLTSIPDKGLTDVVLGFIPLGTSFDDAERILRGAGFSVEPSPGKTPTQNSANKYDVVASIGHFDDRFASRTDLYVDLSPSALGDYSEVHRLTATIIVSLP